MTACLYLVYHTQPFKIFHSNDLPFAQRPLFNLSRHVRSYSLLDPFLASANLTL